MKTLVAALALVASASAQTAPEKDAAVLFANGSTYEQFLAGAQAQHDKWVTNSARETIKPEAVERLKATGTDLQILVIAEAACSDSVNVLPYLAKLATMAGIELRVVNKATGIAVAEAHRTPDGRSATPTVILLRKGKEVGAWVERPSALQTWWLGVAGKISDTERQTRKLAWYDWDRGDTTISEILSLAEKGAGLFALSTSLLPSAFCFLPCNRQP